jgi:hypothetical protein
VRHFGLCVFFQGNCWRDEAAIGERCPDGRQQVGSEPRLNDIAEPACIECGPGEVGVLVDGEEDQTRRPVQAPELTRSFDAVEPRHGDVEHDQIRMEPLRLSEECASIAHCTNDQTFVGQCRGRQREHCGMIISQQHARALRGAGVGDRGSGVHGAISSRFWKSPILSKLTVFARTLASLFQYSMLESILHQLGRSSSGRGVP